MTAKTLRCAIYTRKSSEEGVEQEFNSLDAQREACAAYIKSQAAEGWKLLEDRFDDGGYSGGTLERPAVKRLISEIRARRVDVIVVYKIDRLTRSLADFARLVEILDDHHASFVSVTQQFNTTSSMGRLTLNVLLSFAQFEREVTSERIRDKIAASKRKGMWMGGHPPLGYDIVDRRLAINKKEAQTVQTIFNLALGHEAVTGLKKELARRNIRGKRWQTQTGEIKGGAPFTRSGLARLLRNPVYTGRVRQGGHFYDGEHEAIIASELWESVQALLDASKRGKKRSVGNAQDPALLSGLLFDDAENRMVPTHSKKGAVVYRYYASEPLIRGTKKPVGFISRISAPRLNDEILEALRKAGIAPPGASGPELISHIARIILHPREIEIRLDTSTSRKSLIRVPVNLAAEKNGARIIEGAVAYHRNEALIRAIVLAYGWTAKLETGAATSVQALAAAQGYTERYACKILRLAHLAPDIVEAILDGKQPADLTLHKVNKTPLPSDWQAQREALGFPGRI